MQWAKQPTCASAPEPWVISLEIHQLGVEDLPFALTPLAFFWPNDWVALKEFKSPLDCYLLATIDKWHAWDREGNHRKVSNVLSQALKLTAGPGVLIVIGDKHHLIEAIFVLTSGGLEVSAEISCISAVAAKAVEKVLQWPGVVGVKSGLQQCQVAAILCEHEDVFDLV